MENKVSYGLCAVGLKTTLVRKLVPSDLVLAVLEEEIVMAMRLLGITKVDEISPKMTECIQELWR